MRKDYRAVALDVIVEVDAIAYFRLCGLQPLLAVEQRALTH